MITLHALSKTDLEALAASRVPEALQGRIEDGALPPAFVASRVLQLGAAGHGPPWSTLYLIVGTASARCIGACGFKNAPQDGRVEVGYNVAPAERGQGTATLALLRLVSEAFSAGATEVLAEVAPANIASTRVVQKAGFSNVGARVDEQGEFVVQWIRRAGG